MKLSTCMLHFTRVKEGTRICSCNHIDAEHYGDSTECADEYCTCTKFIPTLRVVKIKEDICE